MVQTPPVSTPQPAKLNPITTSDVSAKSYSNLGNPEVQALVPAHVRCILDIGCGAGDNARIFKSRGIKVDGITLSPEEAASAQPYCRKIWLHNLDKGLPSNLPDDYDGVVCSHVIEHLCWPEPLLTDAHRLLKPKGGFLVVALPNFLYFRNRWNLLRGNFEYSDSGLNDNTHFRWYTFDTGRRLLERTGFGVETAIVSGNAPLWPLRKSLPKGARKAIDSVACRFFPGLFGLQLLYRALPL